MKQGDHTAVYNAMVMMIDGPLRDTSAIISSSKPLSPDMMRICTGIDERIPAAQAAREHAFSAVTTTTGTFSLIVVLLSPEFIRRTEFSGVATASFFSHVVRDVPLAFVMFLVLLVTVAGVTFNLKTGASSRVSVRAQISPPTTSTFA